MNVFKFRAECQNDVSKLMKHIPRKEFNILEKETDTLEGVTITFKTRLPIIRIMRYMGLVEDGHVMYQTISPLEKYTGERNYEIDVFLN